MSRPEQPPDSRVRLPAALRSLSLPGRPLLWIAALVLLVVLGLWLMLTPGGLLGKADAVGYAVCHRIPLRSFVFPDGRALPMCARCSGTFLGVLVGLFVPGLLFRRGRATGFPSLPILGIMIAASAYWAFDGANSFAHLIPAENIPRLYRPTNFLRLFSGMFHGITMGSLVLPIANATLWVDTADRPTLDRWWQLLILYGIGGGLMALVLSGLGVFLYPLAFLSGLGVVAILSVIGMVMASIVLRNDRSARTWQEALPLILIGLTVAFVIIGGIDALRFLMFGSWEGFALPEV